MGWSPCPNNLFISDITSFDDLIYSSSTCFWFPCTDRVSGIHPAYSIKQTFLSKARPLKIVVIRFFIWRMALKRTIHSLNFYKWFWWRLWNEGIIHSLSVRSSLTTIHPFTINFLDKKLSIWTSFFSYKIYVQNYFTSYSFLFNSLPTLVGDLD